MKRQGFTRAEVVSVLAVTGILAAVLLPTFAQGGDEAREQQNAARRTCQSNLKLVALRY